MRTEQLHYLLAISRHESLNAASQELNITPQALGQAIKALEDELEFSLLIRSRQGVRLTAAGEELLQVGQIFLENVAHMHTKYHPPDQASSKILRFSAFSGMIDDLLPDIISSFYRMYPHIKLAIEPAETKEIPQAVLTNQVDFALYCSTAINGISTTSLPPTLSFTPILHADLVYLVHKEHPLAAQTAPLSIKAMESYPILLPDTANMQCSLQEISSYYDFHPTVIYENNYSIFKSLLNSGLNIALGMLIIGQSHLTIPLLENVVSLPIEENIHFLIGYVRLKNRLLSDQAACFLNFFQKYFLTLKPS